MRSVFRRRISQVVREYLGPNEGVAFVEAKPQLEAVPLLTREAQCEDGAAGRCMAVPRAVRLLCPFFHSRFADVNVGAATDSAPDGVILGEDPIIATNMPNKLLEI
jgi:hypothetical protein